LKCFGTDEQRAGYRVTLDICCGAAMKQKNIFSSGTNSLHNQLMDYQTDLVEIVSSHGVSQLSVELHEFALAQRNNDCNSYKIRSMTQLNLK